jgi:hypothetical protein
MKSYSRLFIAAAYIAVMVFLLTSFCIAASALTVVDSMDSGEGWDNAQLQTGDTVEGKGAITCSSSDLLSTSRNFSVPIDMSSLGNGDVLHVWIYIEDAEKLTGNGQLELTSSGTCDVEETSWSLTKEMFKNGWNELTLSVFNADMDTANLSAINYIRFYEFTDGQNSWSIDDLAFGAREEFVSSAVSSSSGDDSEETTAENSMGGFVSKNNSATAGSGPINKYMYYVIFAVSAINIGAVSVISRGGKKS